MKLKKVVAMTMAASMLAGLCSVGAMAEEAGEPVTITMVESLTSPERTAVLREIADKYQEEHPNVTIEIVSPPLENADAKITQMLMNGSGADIVEVRDSTITQYATNEWLADLGQYLDAWEEKDTLTASANEVIYYYQDTAYMIPYGFYQRGLFYRTDWFEENGLAQPETWQDLYDSGVALTDAANSRFGYSFRGGTSGYQYADTIYWSWIGMDKIADPNAAYFLKDGDGATIFTLPEVKEALHFYKDLFTNACPTDSIAWGFSEMVQGFVGGTTAMLIQDPEVIATCSADMGDDQWALVPFPKGPSGQAVFPNGFAGWGMTSFTEHPDETADFLLYLSNAENNTYFAKNYSTIPIHSTASEMDTYFSEGRFAMYMDMAAEPDVYCHAAYPQMYEAFATYKTEVDTMYQKYLTDEITDDDLLTWLDDFWTQAYAEEGQKW